MRTVFAGTGSALGSAVIAVAACSSFGGADEAPAEAGAPTRVDADGGDPAPPDGATPIGYCASRAPAPRFCKDFDGDEPVQFDWSEIGQGKEDRLEADALAYSPPRSLRVALAPGAAANCDYTRVIRSFPTSGEGLVLAFRFRISPMAPNEVRAVTSIEIGQAPSCAVLLDVKTKADGTVGGAELHLQKTAPPILDTFHPLTRFPIENRWTSIELRMRASDAGPQVEALIDGVAANDPLTLPCTFAGTTRVSLGFQCTYGPAEARFDDVTVDYP